MADQSALLRQIPKVDELLAHPVVAAFRHTAAAEATRLVLDDLRRSILDGAGTLPSRDELADRIAGQIRRDERPSLRPLINATGVVLHTNLGRAPLAPSVARAVHDVAAGYSTLEYDVAAGARGSRHTHVDSLVAKLTGAEAAMVVNNNAAAVLLALSALASGKEVIVSRGELVEIGGAFRIPEVMEQSGCILREVGATNRTRLADYERAIDPEKTGALFKAHTSNYRIVGFTEEVDLADLSALGRERGLPVIHDLGSGSLVPLLPVGIHDEPGVADSRKAGADVVCFSGDKLLGGPQAGILAGSAEYIAKMKRHPLARAMRIDKLSLAALEATLRLYLDPDRAWKEIPVLRMIAATEPELLAKAEKLHALLAPLGGMATVVREDGQVGGGSAPTRVLKSAAVEIAPRSMTVVELEQRLRACEPAVIARIARDRLILDVRTVEERDFEYVARCLTEALEENA